MASQHGSITEQHVSVTEQNADMAAQHATRYTLVWRFIAPQCRTISAPHHAFTPPKLEDRSSV